MRFLLACCLLILINPCGFADDFDQQANTILQETGVAGGFVVHLACGDGRLTSALRVSDAYHVHGLSRASGDVKKAREHVLESNQYGSVSIDLLVGSQLPYVDNLVNLLVVQDSEAVSVEEINRVLVPQGVAYIAQKDGTWKKTVKPRPENIDEWSHYLHDASGNAVAHDDVVAQPKHLQWVGSPRWSRHHDRMASMSALVSTNGRMFYVMDEGSRVSIQMPPKWKLIARDAFNGTVLWKRDIPDWQNHLWPLKSGPTALTRRLVSTDDEVYFPFGFKAPLTAVDAVTGETLRTYIGSDGVEEVIHVNGVLLIVANKGPSELDAYTPVNGRVGDQAMVRKVFWDEEPRVLMAYEAKTGKKLWAKSSKVTPLTMSADQQNIYFHDGETLLALDHKTGDLAWQTDPVGRRRQVTFNFGPRVVIHEDVVLYAGGDGKMFGFNATNGKELWSAEHPRSGYQSPQDLMVVNGLVWCAPTTSGKDTGVYTGRDPKTGEVKVEFPPNVDTYWFHHRCYIAKATDNFIMPSRTGIEFVDFKKKDWDIHHWVRGGCLYGVMPCNGLTYAPPHNCACYPEAKLYGFNALAPRAPTRPLPAEISEAGRLEKGIAYADLSVNLNRANLGSTNEDWPTYRHDRERSGAMPQPIDGFVSTAWNTELGGRLTPPVIADGRVYVAQIDQHTLHALNSQSGKPEWSYTIGARIDSPPTILGEQVLFGGADGYVYCLRASDGALAWRYRAAPLDRRTMAYEQLESLWPVHGSVLVIGDVLYTVAGRSMFLDGGLRLIRLNRKTGEKLSETLMTDRHPDSGDDLQNQVKILQMPVGLPDILSTDGKFVYMRSQKFDLEGKRLEIGPNSGDFAEQASVQSGEGTHLFAPMGFLDDSWFHRAYWVHGRSFAGGHGGYHQAGKFAPSGRLLVKGAGYVFGYGRKPEYLRWTTTMEHQLFAADQTPPKVTTGKKGVGKVAGGGGGSVGSFVQFANSASLDPSLKPITVEAWVNTTKPNGVIVARGGPKEGFALTLSNGTPQFHIRSKDRLKTISGKKRIVGGWHHVVGVLSAEKEMRLYVDGQRIAKGIAPGFLATNPLQKMEIGSDQASSVGEYPPSSGFSGAIDEVRLHYDEVADKDVLARFENNDDLPAKPVLVIPFDDESARDMSLLRNNGRIVNARPTEGKFGKAMQFTPGKKAVGKKRKGKQQQVDSHVKPKWAVDVPLYVRSMVLADRTLFMVGPPDIIDEEKTFEKLTQRDPDVEKILEIQDQILEGSQGAMLLRVNADSGQIEQQLELESLPVWDGLAGAQGRLYLTTLKGEVLCIAPNQ